jgi:hypothetical protein
LAPRVSRTSPTPAPFPFSLSAAATRAPQVSHPVHSVVFLTHASTACATVARQRWQRRARGSRPGHGLVSLVPHPRESPMFGVGN